MGQIVASAFRFSRTPAAMLLIMAGAMQFANAVWMTLLNNFAIREAGFSGAEIGALQSVREIPGFLAFTAVFVLLLIREQRFALVSLGLFGFGVALTGFLPSFWGLCLTTLIMSVGFHYYETMSQSLSLQWLAKAEAPRMLGRIVGASSFAAILGYALVYVLWKLAGMDFLALYLLAGGVTLLIAAGLWIAFPQFKEAVPQRKTLFLRRRYWLYYALVFMSGARRQIFVVFAGFLLVERFGFSVPAVAALYFLNQVLNTILAPYIGAMIGRFGERRVLITEYCGLVVIFAGYGLANSGLVAGSLYVADHVFFAMAIAMRTYFQKIADPADIAPTAGVAFSISHIAAIVIPVGFGLVWLWSSTAVFMMGAGMAGISLLLALLVPRHPEAGRETLLPAGRVPWLDEKPKAGEKPLAAE
ncbi:MAG TPA: MFS transporter [Hyphomicrobiales bacterium]|nr:MFS transporter [Hyphomicrobiales bacterium]